LAKFAELDFWGRCELIYVVDDPDIFEPARRLAAELARFYRLPLLLAYGQRNAGYAGACNLGAGLARAAHLLLLNSDVLPDRPGWLGALLAAYRGLPAPGVVAPRLLFEDGGIQHAGMRLVQQPGGLWANTHPGKGLPDSGSGPARECDVLSGACLLIARRLYQQVGGLSEDYILGDFEDSDLCLALRRLGRRNWLLPAVALYHLERQSQNAIGDAAWRTGLTLYNAWRHSRRWAADLAAAPP
jgi:GT2 family glycosyltransferase